MERINKRMIAIVLCVLLFLGWSALFFIPHTRTVEAQVKYLCTWEDGSTTAESFASAYPCLAGGDKERLTLQREGRTGTITVSSYYRNAYEALKEGSLNVLLTTDVSSLLGLEKLALERSFSRRLWYAGEYYRFLRGKVIACNARPCDELVLLVGKITARAILATGARVLHLRREADFQASCLIGTDIKEVVCSLPYEADGNLICLKTPSGRRILGVLPSATRVAIQDAAYFDRGALLPAQHLEELTVPFAGNTLSNAGSDHEGMLAYLFSDGDDYYIPDTLKRVKVTGGVIDANAFYRFALLEEIDLCGIPSEDVSEFAFVDCAALKRLHTSRESLMLPGIYTAEVADCGCFIYELKGAGV